MFRFPSALRPIVLILAGWSLVLLLPAPARAQIEIEITEVPYRPVYAFLRAHFEFGGKQEILHQEWLTNQKDSFIGFGIGLISAKRSDIQFESNISYERFKVDKIGIGDLRSLSELDIQLGGRYLPRFPTFGLGRIPVRLTFSALAGLGLFFAGSYDITTMEMSMILTGGLMISSGDSGSGFLLEFIYRPLEPNLKVSGIGGPDYGTLALKPSFGFRVAWLFGPGGE